MLLPLSTYNTNAVSIPNTRIASTVLKFYGILFDALRDKGEITLSDLKKYKEVRKFIINTKIGTLVTLLRILQATRAFEVNLKLWRRDFIYIRSTGLFDIFPRYSRLGTTYEQYAASILWGLFLRKGSICRNIIERALIDKPEEEISRPSLPPDPTLYEIVLAYLYPETLRAWPKIVGSALGTNIINKFKAFTDVGVLLTLASISGMILLDASKVRSIAHPASLEEYPRGLRRFLRSVLGRYVSLKEFISLLKESKEASESLNRMPPWQRLSYEVLKK